jgi:hypothetical protein
MTRRRLSGIRMGVAAIAIVCAGTVIGGEPRATASVVQQEAARVSVPPLILFEVHDPRVTTEAATGATTITFDDAAISPGRVLRISVKAEGDLTRGDGAPSADATISWRTSGASNGIGVNGVLAKSAFTQVFQANAAARSGSVSVTWSIAFNGAAPRAGTHQVALRWRIDSVIP